jgi:hypothetical protein
MKRASYFSRVGVKTVKSQLDAVFAAEQLDVASLRQLARCGDDIPKTYRARVWTHLLLGWRSLTVVPFLAGQLQGKFGDLRRAALVLNQESLEKVKKSRRKAAEMLTMLQLLSRVRGSQAEGTPEELESVLLVFLGVFPEEAAAQAFYCFERSLLQSRAEVVSLCNRTREMLTRGQQELVDVVDDRVLRSWFCTLFAAALRDQVILVWDALFSYEPMEQGGFLAATACAIVRLNVRPEASTEVLKITTPVAQIVRLAIQIHENKKTPA